MRRAGRILFLMLSAGSLLLCVAMCVTWGRSYWRQDDVGVVAAWVGETHREWGLSAVSSRGALKVSSFWWSGPDWRREDFRPGVRWTWESEIDQRPAETAQLTYQWLAPFDAATHGVTVRELIVWTPHWCPAAALAILPSVGLRARLRDRKGRGRLRDGLCPKCGYDLRASPGRCPECGADAV